MVDDLKTVCCRNLFKALSRGERDEAAVLLERLREEDPLSVETRGFELKLLLRGDKLQETERLAGQLVEQFPSSPRIPYLAGRFAYRRRDYHRDEERRTESHRLCANTYCRRFLGKTLTQLGRFDEAESILLGFVLKAVAKRLDSTPIFPESVCRSRFCDRLLDPRIGQLETRVATRTAWVCYHLQAYDFACRLFLQVFEAHCGQPKFLAPLEAAAKRSGSLADLLPYYERAATDDPRFFGRIRGLRRRIESTGS